MAADDLDISEPAAPATSDLASRAGPEAHLDEWVAPDIADEQVDFRGPE